MTGRLASCGRQTAWCVAAALLWTATAMPAAAAMPPANEWNFQVALDGTPIGEHRFRLSAPAAQERVLTSEARFAVKLLGLVVYRYRHDARELWRDGCLEAITAETQDDGKVNKVDLRFPAPGSTTPPAEGMPACTLSFAYWNPAIRSSTQLLNAQTGKIDAVQVVRQGEGTLDVRGETVAAVRWRITGLPHPIDLWYAADGAWIGLDSTVGSGRRLSYRLK
ncbi:DUF6134 family protein [Acidovorax sp. SUPP1855]|uniref:DUF6134 family protein n=1 Tax=Acidovorax sp. SUPP1855 TaxID=431774 RepID=UPI0023DE5FED|nr:DUF6134 family protein [Acidovorax sp. SUPP1855]GKS83180.1 DUF6134 family protein [Acidovorax sp. SUPP1855]